jgi:hypothetical protein
VSDRDTMGPIQGAFTVVTLLGASALLLAGALAKRAIERLIRYEQGV